MGNVLLAKRALRSPMSTADAERVTEKLYELPSAMSGQFHNLDIKPLSAQRRQLWRLRVGDFRVIYEPAGSDVVVYRIERRDDTTYSELDRIAVARRTEGLQIVEVSGQPHPSAVPTVDDRTPVARARPKDRENPLTPFSVSELKSLGLDNDAIATVRTLSESVDIAETLAELGVSADVIEAVADAWHSPAAYLGKLASASGAELLSPLTADELSKRARATESSDVLADLDEEEFASVLQRPIEDWMFYLHPSQARVVRHPATGPSRVRGGPGTGKTVAALHRARFLVKESGAEKVLLTTFISALPAVWFHLLKVFAKEEGDRIDTRTVDSLAVKIITKTGERFTVVDSNHRYGLANDILGSIDGLKVHIGGANNLIQEFDYVIAGRGIASLDDYLKVERVGRRSALVSEGRELVWRAYERYKQLLTREDKIDHPHLRLWALRLVKEGAGPRFDAVVVDEAQDLTEVGIRLLMGVDASEDHSGMLLVGDGQQAIYPGGFSLRSVGLDVRGRSFLLKVNWRNTQMIATTAEGVVGDVPFGDLEDDLKRTDAEAGVPRRLGTPVHLHVVRSGYSEGDVLTAVVDDLLTKMRPEDIAVLGRTNKVWQAGQKALERARHQTAKLSSFRDGLGPGIRVGTFPGSKGLEFKAVVLLGIDGDRWCVSPFWLNDERDKKEHLDRELRTLFVAMTRARDELVLISSGQIPDVVERARSDFDIWEWV